MIKTYTVTLDKEQVDKLRPIIPDNNLSAFIRRKIKEHLEGHTSCIEQ